MFKEEEINDFGVREQELQLRKHRMLLQRAVDHHTEMPAQPREALQMSGLLLVPCLIQDIQLEPPQVPREASARTENQPVQELQGKLMTQKVLTSFPVSSDPSRGITVSPGCKFVAMADSESAAAFGAFNQNQQTFPTDDVQENHVQTAHETSDCEDPSLAQGQTMVSAAHTMKSDIDEVPPPPS